MKTTCHPICLKISQNNQGPKKKLNKHVEPSDEREEKTANINTIAIVGKQSRELGVRRIFIHSATVVVRTRETEFFHSPRNRINLRLKRSRSLRKNKDKFINNSEIKFHS